MRKSDLYLLVFQLNLLLLHHLLIIFILKYNLKQFSLNLSLDRFCDCLQSVITRINFEKGVIKNHNSIILYIYGSIVYL